MVEMKHDKFYISGGTAVFEKKCSVTSEIYKVEVDAESVWRWKRGKLIQDAMPNLAAEQREFVRIGLTPAEYDKMFETMTDPDTENL